MKRTAATIIREYGPFPNVTHVHGVSFDGVNVWIATGDTLNAIEPASGKTVRALDVPAHAGTAFDGQHPVPDLRGSHPESRSEYRPRSCDHPDTRRRRLGNGVGRRNALGWAASQAQDPSGRSADRRDPSHHRLKSLRHRGHLGGRRTLARYLGIRAKRSASNRSTERRSPGTARHADRHRRIGPRIKRQRYLLLRRRKQRKSESRPSTRARLRDQTAEVGGRCRASSSNLCHSSGL